MVWYRHEKESYLFIYFWILLFPHWKYWLFHIFLIGMILISDVDCWIVSLQQNNIINILITILSCILKVDTSICIGYSVKWQNLSAVLCYIVYSYIADEFIGNLDQNKTFHHLWNLALEDNTVWYCHEKDFFFFNLIISILEILAVPHFSDRNGLN